MPLFYDMLYIHIIDNVKKKLRRKDSLNFMLLGKAFTKKMQMQFSLVKKKLLKREKVLVEKKVDYFVGALFK